MADLHVLILPSSYPTRVSPSKGIFFQGQALALRKIGLNVGVVYPEFRSLRTLRFGGLKENLFQVDVEEEDGVSTVLWKGWNVPSSWIRGRLFVGKSLKLIEYYIKQFGKPDLIHAHGVLWGGIAAMRASQEFSIPYVITEHSSAFVRGLIRPWQIPVIAKGFHDASRVFAVSNSLARELQNFAGRFDIQVLPNMVDTSFFRNHPSRVPQTRSGLFR